MTNSNSPQVQRASINARGHNASLDARRSESWHVAKCHKPTEYLSRPRQPRAVTALPARLWHVGVWWGRKLRRVPGYILANPLSACAYHDALSHPRPSFFPFFLSLGPFFPQQGFQSFNFYFSSRGKGNHPCFFFLIRDVQELDAGFLSRLLIPSPPNTATS